MFGQIVRLFIGLASLAGGIFIAPTSHAGFPLPHYTEVEPASKMVVDGIWLLTANNKRIRIEKGRAYALDGWQQVFSSYVDPEKVVLKNITFIGKGSFSGDDLPLSRKFNAKIQANGDLVFQVGLIFYTFTPVELDDPIEYAGAMSQAGLDPKKSEYLNNWIIAKETKRKIKGEPDKIDPSESSELDTKEGQEEEGPDGDQEYAEEESGDQDSVEEPGDQEYTEPEAEEYAEFEVEEESESEIEEEAESEVEEEVELEPKRKVQLKRVKAKVHAKVKPKKIACTGKNVYLSKGACYRCARNYKRASITREMSHPQACQKRGLPQYSYSKAKYVGKAKPIRGCPGKDVYRSDGGCYTCPAGHKRASATRKMNHAQACQKRGLPKHQYTHAKLVYKLDLNPLPCPRGQFKHNGYCKSCPEGTKRVHALGVDSGFCVYFK